MPLLDHAGEGLALAGGGNLLFIHQHLLLDATPHHGRRRPAVAAVVAVPDLAKRRPASVLWNEHRGGAMR